MSQNDVDVVVIGAGVVGLAAAAALASAGRSVFVLEARSGIAQEGTSRNSEVIHAGIYYPKESLKAKLCREGRDALYRRCAERRIPHARLGKLIVTTRDDELPDLEKLYETASANDVPGIQILSAAEVRRREPAIRTLGALLSPETGIVDAHSLSLSYQAEAEEGGAMVLLEHRVVALEAVAGGWRVVAERPGGQGEESVACTSVVNAAGLASDRVAGLAGIDVDARGYRQHPCKGDYFGLAPGRSVELSQLVYPLPAGGGLGIHTTLDLAGRLRFGPDAEYVSEPHYDVDPAKAAVFAEAVSRYLPDVTPEWLVPDYAGVRTKLSGPGQPFADFVVAEESDAGLPGLVNCIGIESPGLTSSWAIGRRVARLLDAL